MFLVCSFMIAAVHQPVMAKEVLHFLNPAATSVIVDATVGTAGHSLQLVPHLIPNGKLIAIDRDRQALEVAQQRLGEFQSVVTTVHGDFRQLSEILKQQGLSQVDGILFDLGMSSFQLDCAERGFSFLKEGPLDMRMDSKQSTTAAALIHKLSAAELHLILRTFGEERFARRIVSRIIQERGQNPIETTTQLAQLISRAVPKSARYQRLHPATRTFQALRMAVNDEGAALQAVLECIPSLLRPKGRLVVISFHSIEDRMVKRALVHWIAAGWWTPLTKKPVRPSAEEVMSNPRARSAKLRAAQRCA